MILAFQTDSRALTKSAPKDSDAQCLFDRGNEERSTVRSNDDMHVRARQSDIILICQVHREACPFLSLSSCRRWRRQGNMERARLRTRKRRTGKWGDREKEEIGVIFFFLSIPLLFTPPD